METKDNVPYFTCQHRKEVDQSFIFSERFNWKEKASTQNVSY